MKLAATLANTAWAASGLPDEWHFRRALADPAAVQHAILMDLVRRAASTAFGVAHGFEQIRNYARFARRLPPRDYGEFEPWIRRIRGGEPRVLTADPVLRLATTGGTTSARKLIPYTRRLQADFNRAIGPWMIDLFRARPRALLGRAYWSVSPVARTAAQEPSAVPIGFEEDSEYLGGVRRRLVDAVMAVPSHVRHAKTMDDWRRMTVDHLSRCRDLRLISVWHPSFLSLLLDALPEAPHNLWPNLQVVSCWTDGHSQLPAVALARRLPHATVQPKGLIATEAIVSIPYRRRWPLAITSHFFEFVATDGRILLAHELEQGAQYEVLVTTAGGLFRYRLNDLIRVDGFLGRTPSIRFVGKTGHISDRFGEKLSEAFVGQVLRQLQSELNVDWAFSMLAPHENEYVLFVQGEAPRVAIRALDAALRANPHYAYCRDLGQLRPPRLFQIADGTPVEPTLGARQRLGEVKALALSNADGWADRLRGTFIT